MNLAAIVLCGGGSRRMGRDKATLDFHGEPMLARVVRIASQVVPPERLTCVAAQGQTLPELPSSVQVVRDRHADNGPLEGLATGFAALPPCEAVLVTTCDAPLLVPDLLGRLVELLGARDGAVPEVDGQLYPLTAVYRPSVAVAIEHRLARGERRVIDWVAGLDVQRVTADELRSVDPQLNSLKNCNTPEEYEQLLAMGESR